VRRGAKKEKKSTFEVKVSKSVLKAARQSAKVKGDSLDDVVTAALRAYVARA